MSTYMENENWGGPGQMSIAEVQKNKAPNPAEFPETPHKSLSYWIREYAIDFEDGWVNMPPPETVDLAIIGSGITGATAAYKLSQLAPDLKVAVFESRGLCTGATGRNGGLIGRPESYDVRALAKTFGLDEAIRLRQFTRTNREMMVEAINELGAADAVDLDLTGAMVIFASQEERDTFIADDEFARENGLKTLSYVIDAEELTKRAKISSSTAKFGAACLDGCGTIYPRKFVAVMLKRALERMKRLSLHPFTPVSGVEYDASEDHKYLLHTSKGPVRARSILHATNAYVTHLVPALQNEDGVFGCSAHMMGIQPNVEKPEKPEAQVKYALGYRECFHWFLQRPHGGPFLYGLWKAEVIGRYNDTLTLEKTNTVREEMFTFLQDSFPHKFKNLKQEEDVTFDWQGVQGWTKNGASIVGRPESERKEEFVAVGFNGEGMGRCFASASVVTDAILAQLNGDEKWQPPPWFPHSYRRNM